MRGKGGFEIFYSFFEALVEVDGGLPVEGFSGEGDVGFPLERVVAGEGFMDDLRPALCHVDNFVGEFEDGEFAGVTDIDRANFLVLIHHADHGFDQVVNVAEGAGLCPLPVYCDVLIVEGLADEIRDDPTIIGTHPGSVGIEYSDDADFDIVFAVVIEEEGFGAALAFIVAGTEADGIDIATIGLDLRGHLRVSVYFAGAGLQHPGVGAFRQSQHIDRPHHRSFDGLDRIELVMDR